MPPQPPDASSAYLCPLFELDIHTSVNFVCNLNSISSSLSMMVSKTGEIIKFFPDTEWLASVKTSSAVSAKATLQKWLLLSHTVGGQATV